MTCIEVSTQQSIGHLLLEAGRIDEEMLAYALKVQQVSSERLGDILQRLRLVTDRDIAWVVAKRFVPHLLPKTCRWVCRVGFLAAMPCYSLGSHC